ncbi:UNVERIFIED_CONTAM: hypothetical protein PYX00_005678 [Menopon gallinae]|uniref:TM7S3/TM198-like domain-containing protein n=1 Tax=Menopon gallinae TaxID=328185 RepID=A0AAW2HSV0_9NEOP
MMVKMCRTVNCIKTLICILVAFSDVAQCQVPVIADKSVITLSLKSFNVSDPNGESVENKYLIQPNSSCEIKVLSVPDDAYFVVLQAHSYFKDLTLSYGANPTRETSVTGMNTGLVKIKTSPVLSFHLFYNSSPDNATVLIAVQAYGHNAPIPGGCNMEFQVETSPFLKMTFSEAVTEVDFAPAAPSLHFLSSVKATPDDLCNVKPNPLSYSMYRMYLPERNSSEELYFNSLSMMMTRGRILRNGRNVPDKYGGSPMRHIFASYPGTGSVFVVVAETEEGRSVYVPSFTYSCNVGDSDDCRVLTTTFSKLLCAAIFFLGLFACFAAHRFFKIELVLLGFLSGTVLCYVAALSLGSAAPLTLSVGVGVVCGVAFILTWCFSGAPLFSLISATSILGSTVAACVFYKLVDVFDALENDVNYWSVFGSIVLLGPILMIPLSEKANIIACSIVGAYASVLAIDYYVGSNLRYIVINAIRRTTVPKFRHAIIDPPFQTKDIVLSIVWIILAIAGVTAQMLLMQGRPPYPAPINPIRKFIKRYKSTGTATERTPLLRSSVRISEIDLLQ